MKSLIKILGALALAAAFSACGKKGGSNSTAPAAASAATDPALSAGYVGVNKYQGNLVVTDRAHYLVFLQDQGLCFGSQCSSASGFFSLQVQTISEMLPEDVNFTLVPRFSYIRARGLRTRGEGYMTADGRGFQVQYRQYSYSAGLPTATPYGGVGVGWGAQPLPAGTAKTLYITLTFADTANAIANVTVQYEGFTIASGQMRAAVATGLRTPTPTPYR